MSMKTKVGSLAGVASVTDGYPRETTCQRKAATVLTVVTIPSPRAVFSLRLSGGVDADGLSSWRTW
jgi:hypothetical protein